MGLIIPARSLCSVAAVFHDGRGDTARSPTIDRFHDHGGMDKRARRRSVTPRRRRDNFARVVNASLTTASPGPTTVGRVVPRAWSKAKHFGIQLWSRRRGKVGYY